MLRFLRVSTTSLKYMYAHRLHPLFQGKQRNVLMVAISTIYVTTDDDLLRRIEWDVGGISLCANTPLAEARNLDRAHNLPLEDHEQHDQRQHRQHGCGHDERRVVRVLLLQTLGCRSDHKQPVPTDH